MAINSYTKSNADLLLLSALWRVPAQVGFYIDVGAGNREKDSITKLLYETGWRGINIEPSAERFARLTETRKRDVNIEAVASNTSGEVIFRDIVGEQLGTAVDESAKRHSDAGRAVAPVGREVGDSHATLREARPEGGRFPEDRCRRT